MTIILSINRTKQGDTIIENFSVHPSKIHYLFETNRMIYYALWYLINKYSLHNHYDLIDIHYFEKNTIYIYKYNEDIIVDFPLSQQITIEYMPVLGEKKCKNCYYNKNEMCIKRGKRVNKKIFKCQYWMERALNNTERFYGNIYVGEGSKISKRINR